MAENFTNGYQSTLSSSAAVGDGTITVVSTTGAPSANFRVLVDSELMLVTAVAGNTLTVARHVEGTTAAAHNSGALATQVLTAGGLSAGFAGLDTANAFSQGQTFNARINFSAHYGAITSDTYGSTITFNLATSDYHQVTLTGNATLALSNDVDGQRFALILQQDGTGGRTVTWWSGIVWPGGIAPSPTPGANVRDVFSFIRLSSGVYLGMYALNFH